MPIRFFHLPLIVCLLSLILLAPGSDAQIEEEDLASATPTVRADDDALGIADLTQRLDDLEAALRTGMARGEALLALDELVAALDARSIDPALPLEARALLADVLARRAVIYDEIGDSAGADLDLVRLIETSPNLDLATLAPSASLYERFTALRRTRVGTLDVTRIEPLDMEIVVDGWPMEGDTITVTAGTVRLEARRPGYAELSEDIEVRAARSTARDLELVRDAPVLRLATRPNNAAVYVDGALVGSTEGTAAPADLPAGATARFGADGFSSQLVIDDIALGVHQLEIRRDGFRPYRTQLFIEDLLDYELPPVVLQPEQGTIVLLDLPANARVRLNGELIEIERSGTRGRIEVDPGSHSIDVRAGATKMWGTRLDVADRQTVELRVEPRLALVLLGVFGGDANAADRLADDLTGAVRATDRWTLIDRRPEAISLLDDAGIDVATMRADSPQVDWTALQRRVDDELPGFVYLIALFGDDVLARDGELVMWTTAPGPALPDRVPIALDSDPRAAVTALLDRTPELFRPWSGVLPIDSDAVAHPVIGAITPGGPGEAAGLVAGDLIVAVDGASLDRAATMLEKLTTAQSDETVTLIIRTPDGTAKEVDLRLGRGPSALDPTAQPRSLAWAALATIEERRAAPEWLIDFNRAVLLLDARDPIGAVRLLREIEAAERSHGFGQAAVYYTLGRALEAVGLEYRSAAADAYRRAAGIAGARFGHHDGPFVAPRARARLHALGESTP
ncbi:MAG: PDZ domain-containing protein [Acidobacteriota bacterium]